jgi:hypothetical protein
MALHTELSIHKAAHDLFVYAITLARNFPRDVKKLLGDEIRDLCLAMVTLIYQANKARDLGKLEPLDALLERQVQIEVLLRVARDMKFISPNQYAHALAFTEAIGRQAHGWRKKYATSPAA